MILRVMQGHASNFKEKFNYALRETNDTKMAYKEDKDQVLDLK